MYSKQKCLKNILICILSLIGGGRQLHLVTKFQNLPPPKIGGAMYRHQNQNASKYILICIIYLIGGGKQLHLLTKIVLFFLCPSKPSQPPLLKQRPQGKTLPSSLAARDGVLSFLYIRTILANRKYYIKQRYYRKMEEFYPASLRS